MAIRVKSENETFRKGAVIAVSIYTLAFLVWLVMVIVGAVQVSKNCPALSGNQVLLSFLIGCLSANGAIVVWAVVVNMRAKSQLA